MSTRTQPLVKLAAGGTATVWIGTASSRPNALVAIKRPHPHLFDDPRFVSALQREAAIASRLDHPNVVHMHELLTVGDSVELIMEYVDGLALSDLIRAWETDATDRTLPAALRIAIDVCAGLEAVHALADADGVPLGLVHRDVSPQNVLVSAEGVAKIADFGLTRSIAFGDRSTTDGVLKGKAGYLAPEYVRGAPIDQRIDVFALGVVLWEAIAKRRLFKGENEADTLQRILRCEIPSLADSKIDAALAADLDALLARALAKAPADRFATATEMKSELLAFLERHALRADAAAVVESFGPTARAAVNRQRASVVRARTQPAPVTPPPQAALSEKSAPRSKLPLVAGVAAAVVIAAVGSYSLRSVEKTAPLPIASEPGSVAPSVAPVASMPPATPEFEIIDAVPVPPAESASGARIAGSSRHARSTTAIGSASTAPPQPRKNPY